MGIPRCGEEAGLGPPALGPRREKGIPDRRNCGGKGLEAGGRRRVEVGLRVGREAWVPASPGTCCGPWVCGAQFPHLEMGR